MKWIKQIYIGESVAPEWDHIKELTEMKQYPGSVLYITKAANRIDQLDICAGKDLSSEAVVFGIAKGRKEALELVQHMTEDCYRETGDVNIKEYLSTLE